MTIIIFIIVLLVCVVAHEFGHFIVAKKSGMLVEEFGFGIPPRLYAKKKGETVYSINALPIGGFVKIAGEDGKAEGVPLNRQFDGKPWYIRSLVLVAGVVCNILLAFVLFTIAYTIGMPAIVTSGGTPTIITVESGSPAQKAGLNVGDTVDAIAIGSDTPSLNTEALHNAIVGSTLPIAVVYRHGGTVHTTTITPEGTGTSRHIGLEIEQVTTVHQSLWSAIKNAALQIVSLIGTIWATLAGLVGGLFHHRANSIGLMGPVGLAHAVGDAATIGFTYLLAFTAAISVNLAVLNIMPFPALDGGRLIVVWLEAFTGRKFSPTVVGIIHAAGFLLLIILMVVLTIGDIRKLL